MLNTLQDMNVLLHIRLTLHEDLPHYLRDWKCANGRATFTFPGEFEFDLILLDEDPSAQLWFEDLRFLFTPSFVIPDGVFRTRLQDGADEALKTSGIPGCAEYLRNFVLTHQITLLRNQLSTLIRGIWKSVLSVEQRHRSLIVQYWAESPFAKSWLEIGISSGKGKKRLMPGRVELPKISARWRRYGEEVPEGQLDLGLQHPSMEGILRGAISTHSSHLLRTTRDTLQKAADNSTVLSLDLHESATEPIDCKLVLQLGGHSPKITFAIEQFSGRLTLHPATSISHYAEYELNNRAQTPSTIDKNQATPRNPTRDVPAILETFICSDMFWRIERQAAFSGWEPVVNVRATPDVLRETFGFKPIRLGFFRPGTWSGLSMTANWVVCVIINLEGCRWWAVELYVSLSYSNDSTLDDKADMLDCRTNSLDRPAILAVQALPLASNAMNSAPLDATLLANLEDEAERCIAEMLSTQQMRQDVTLFNGWSGIAVADEADAAFLDQLVP
jgi:mediator of RNA polymerase II transcription subunit 14